MPSCGIGLGLPYAGTGIDPDALAYFNRAGITDSTARQQILDFVKGVKALGLWNNFVCWPLRSSQNVGSGVIARSLGGLGTFDGTFTSSGALPTWGADGINLDASIQGMGGASLSALSQQVLTGGYVIRRNATNTVNRLLFSTSGGSRNFALAVYGSTTIGMSRLGAFDANGTLEVGGLGSSAFVSSFEMASANQNAGNLNIFRNGSLIGSLASTPLTRIESTQVMFGSIFASGTHVIPFAYFSTLSSANTASIYSLYKSTLGVGLGLP